MAICLPDSTVCLVTVRDQHFLSGCIPCKLGQEGWAQQLDTYPKPNYSRDLIISPVCLLTSKLGVFRRSRQHPSQKDGLCMLGTRFARKPTHTGDQKTSGWTRDAFCSLLTAALLHPTRLGVQDICRTEGIEATAKLQQRVEPTESRHIPRTADRGKTRLSELPPVHQVPSQSSALQKDMLGTRMLEVRLRRVDYRSSTISRGIARTVRPSLLSQHCAMSFHKDWGHCPRATRLGLTPKKGNLSLRAMAFTQHYDAVPQEGT